jgi:hypothetical protein
MLDGHCPCVMCCEFHVRGVASNDYLLLPENNVDFHISQLHVVVVCCCRWYYMEGALELIVMIMFPHDGGLHKK